MWSLSSREGGGKAIVAGPLKKMTFLRFPLVNGEQRSTAPLFGVQLLFEERDNYNLITFSVILWQLISAAIMYYGFWEYVR